MELTVISQSASRIRLGWQALSGVRGYEFFVDGKRVSHTMDASRTSVDFGIPDDKPHTYKIEAMVAGESGEHVVNAPQPPPTPTGSGRGVASFRWGDVVPRAQITDWQKLDLVMVDLDDPDIRKLLTATRVLMYRSSVSCHYQYDSCIPHAQAEANGWLLKDAGGNYLTNPQFSSGSDPCHILDVFNPKVALAVGQAFVGWCKMHDLNGVFLDDVVSAWRTLVSGVPAGMTEAQCHAAMVNHVRNVSTVVRQAGFESVANANGRIPGDGASDVGDNHLAFWNELAGDGKGPSGLTPEYWMQNPINPQQVRLMGAEWYNHWDGWRRLHPWCNQHGVDFLPLQYGEADSPETLFARASFLLDYNGGKSALISGMGNGNNPYGPVWCRRQGTAAGPPSAANGVWTRSFQFETTKVNVAEGSTTYSGANFQPARFLLMEAGESPDAYPPAPWRHRHVKRMRAWAKSAA